METTQTVFFEDIRNSTSYEISTVDLVVTSPPYPMIEMWDNLFSSVIPDYKEKLTKENGFAAFDACHDWLDEIWTVIDELTSDDVIFCINIGDATRKTDNSFSLYPNHARIIQWFTNNGYEPLPTIKWRKPSNKSASYMGSGMIPPNAYVSLDTEYILLFRKNTGTRTFPSKDPNRYESAYFWEERNKWFSDLWEITGENQYSETENTRDRTAAYPFEIPKRLVTMFSVYQDTVLDPFLGTGTTLQATSALCRNGVGFEIDPSLQSTIEQKLNWSNYNTVQQNRLTEHKEFIRNTEKTHPYTNERYNIPVKTKQEKNITLYKPVETQQTSEYPLINTIEYEKITANDFKATSNS